MNGLHLTADLYDCRCTLAVLSDAEALAIPCRREALAAGLTIVGEKWHRFPDVAQGAGGVTGVLLLAESHLALHTWPERRGVTLDVYVCNYGQDNSARAEALLASLIGWFEPAAQSVNRLQRGLAAPDNK